MPRSCWCILAAFVGWLILGQPEQAASQPAKTSQSSVDNAANTATLQQANEPGEYQKKCEPGEENRASDLCAQWKAADAAKSAAQAAWWIGIVGSLIGAFTLAAAWAAARYAKLAADHTKTGADAAEGSLAVQREAVALQLRPYVMFFNAEKSEPKKPFTNKSSFPISFKNFGQTPAYKVILRQGCMFRPKPVGFEEVPLHGMEIEPVGTLGPGGESGHDIFVDWLDRARLAKVRSGALVLLLRFRVEYVLKSGESDFDDVTLVLDKAAWREGGPRGITGQYRREK